MYKKYFSVRRFSSSEKFLSILQSGIFPMLLICLVENCISTQYSSADTTPFFTEDFSTSTLMDKSKTFANWSTDEQKLLLSFFKTQTEAFNNIDRSEISNDTHFTNDIVIGDVDGDGDLDLITGNHNEPNRLYLNNGTSNPFEREIGKNITSEIHPTSTLTLGDIDWDGDLDLIEGNIAEENRVYFNNGSLDPFNDSVSMAIPGAFPTSGIELADVDGDGDFDLIESNYDEENKLYLNNGTHEPFKDVTSTSISTGSFKTTNVEIGDLNGDGAPDIVFANEDERNFLHLNLQFNGETFEGFSTGIPVSTDADSTQSIGLGDLNGDGALDLIAGNNNTPSRLYLNNNTDNPFQNVAGSNITIDIQNVQDIQIGDVNGDGSLDLVTGNDGQRTRLYLNNGTSNPFNNVIGRNIFALDQDNTSSILLGDLDRDGDLDLITGNRAAANSTESQTNKLYLNDTSISQFSQTDISIFEGITNAAAVGDVDHDGFLDLITGNNNEPNLLYINNRTNSPFEGVTGINISDDAHATRSVVLGDVDNNGSLDLIAGNLNQPDRLYLNNGTNNPFSGVTGIDISSDSFATTTVVAADMNNDGSLDLIMGIQNDSNRLFINNGTNNPFAGVNGQAISSDTSDTRSLVVGDIDNDNDLDLITGNFNQTNLIFFNNGLQNPFDGIQGIALSLDENATNSLALGDVDNDGDLDLIEGNFAQPNQLYLNDAQSFNTNGTPISSDAFETQAVDVGDIDNDGDLDLIEINNNQINRYYLNDGTDNPFEVAFGLHFSASDTAFPALALAKGDVNNDGYLDLIVSSDNPFTNRLYLNDGNLEGELFNTNLGAAASRMVHIATQPIERVTLQTDAVLPAGTYVDYYVSNNNGEQFKKVQNGEFLTFQTVGTGFLWKAVLHSLSPIKTPELFDLQFFKDAVTNIDSGTEQLMYRVKTPALNVLKNVTIQDQDEVLVKTILLSIQREGSAEGDTLGLQGNGDNLQVDIETNTITYNDSVLGTFTVSGNSLLTISFNNENSPIQADAIQSILRNVTFDNQSETRNDNTRTLTVTFTDEKGRMIGVRDANNTLIFQLTKTILTSVNFPPVLNVNTQFDVIEDVTTAITSSQLLTVDDLDASQIIYTLTTLPQKGTLKNGELELSLDENNTFTQADINNEQIEFIPHINLNGDDQFTFTIEDIEGEILDTPFTFDISISPINDTPLSQVPDTKTFVKRNSTVVIEGISFIDVDVNETTLEPLLDITFSVSQGDLIFEGITNQLITKTGTIDELNTLIADGALAYQPDTGFLGSDILVIEVSDRGNTGEGGAKSSSSTIVIEVFRLLQLHAELSSF